MIAAWMLYCVLCALGLSGAAVLAERTLLAGRGPVRLVWIATVALSLIVPALAFRFGPRLVAVPSTATVSEETLPGPSLDHPLPNTAALANAPRSAGWNWRSTLARIDGPLAIAWATLSVAVAFNFLGGIIALAWMRRRWQRRTVLGVPVYVSERTGPAVVGVVSQAIVLPEWSLALEPRQLSLMLKHEQEHRRAGDGRVLTVAELALIAMPWNVALWWQILRLRVAVELDCDARVLQDADPRSYGDLLLEVARPGRRPGLMGATAFAERATQLERRIRVLSRHRVRTSRRARALASCIGLAAVTVAWVAPRPPAPARASDSLVAPPPVAAPTVGRIAQTPVLPQVNGTDRSSGGAIAPKPAPQPVSSSAQPLTLAATTPIVPERKAEPGTSALPAATLAPCARAGGPEVAPVVDAIFNRLFDGIALSREQEARACDMLIRLQQEQAVQDAAAAVAIAANRLRRIELEASRDSALRALLTNDADRATFDVHVAEAPVAPRGRGAGADVSSRGGGRGRRADLGDTAMRVFGRARGGGRGDLADTFRLNPRSGGGTRGRGDMADTTVRFGRGGGGGGRGRGDMADTTLRYRLDGMNIALTNFNTEMTLRRLFAGISLTAEQESSARALIARTQQDMRTQTPLAEPPRLRMNPATGMVTMQAASAEALGALLTNEADRARLQSRITTGVPLRPRNEA